MTTTFRKMQVGDSVRVGCYRNDDGDAMTVWNYNSNDNKNRLLPVPASKVQFFEVGAVVQVDDQDDSYCIILKSTGYRYWFFNTPLLPTGNTSYDEAYPALAESAAVAASPRKPDYTETVMVNKHSKVPDRIIQEMMDRGECVPRRTLTRWPDGKRWVSDGGKRTVTGTHQDSFTIHWYWETEPNEN